MTALLLTGLLLLQGAQAAQSGLVTGLLKSADGRAISGIRVAAIPAAADITDAAMAGIGETNDQGRFVLAGLPPGRYYIAAGRVDAPVYFPGTQDLKSATVVAVKPGESVFFIDFAMENTNLRPAGSVGFVGTQVYAVPVPLQVRVEGGGKLPLSSGGRLTLLRVTSSARGMPPSATSINVPTDSEVAFSVDNLPPGYAVRSITYGALDLRTERLKLPPAYLSSTEGAFVRLADPAAQGGRSQSVLLTLPYPALDTITIVLMQTPQPVPPTGVRVTGQVFSKAVRSVYLSGLPGILYTDGSFEFAGVPPGRHVLAGLDSDRPLGAFVIVGDREVNGVELKDVAVPLPSNMRTPQEPSTAGTANAGATLSLATVSGILRDEASQKPISGGILKVTGYEKTETFATDSEGRFAISRLFPGEYTLETEIFGHERRTQTLIVGPENVALNLTSRSLY